MTKPPVIIYGTSWCGDCHRTQRFFKSLGLSYKWIDIDRDQDGEAFVLKTNQGMRSVPTVVFEDGSLLVEPSNKTLAHKLGIEPIPSAP